MPYSFTPRPLPQPRPQAPIDPLGQVGQLAYLARSMDVMKARRQQEQDEGLLREAFNAGGGHRRGTVSYLTQRGRHDLAQQAEANFSQQAIRQQDELRAGYQRAQEGLKYAGGLLDSVSGGQETGAPERWAGVRDELRTVLPPQLAEQVPEGYDAAWVDRWRESGRTLEDRIKDREERLDRARQGLKDDKEALEVLAPWLADAQNPEEWNERREIARDWYPQLTDGFDALVGDFDPERAKRGFKAEREQDLSLEEQDLAAYARDVHGTTSGKLTHQQRLAFFRQRADARRPSERATDRVPSIAQRGASERALASALADIDERQASYTAAPMSESELQRAKLRAFNAYRKSQVSAKWPNGWEAWTRLPTVPAGHVLMRAPDGEEDVVLEEHVRDAQREGFVIVPYE